MRPVAIIPARGGSKRLSRKNILLLGGKPLMAHIISTALNSNIFEKVIVSTEDEEIAKVASEFGAEVFIRNSKLAQDSSTVVEVCLDVLRGYQVDDFCCLYATSALLSVKTLKESYNVFQTTKPSVLMGVSSYNYSPVQALTVDNNGNANLLIEEYRGVQSQYHPKLRVSNGSLYWAKKQSFIKEKTFYSEYLNVFDVPENEVCDVDTEEDYKRLIKKYEDRF
jgi:pseudaminic acid cytidylyltransferase